jgi:homocysteine S-methyltransferase
MNNEVPGASVPQEILARMRNAPTKEAAFAEGVAIARETFEHVRPLVAGVQLSAPLGRIEGIFTMLGR